MTLTRWPDDLPLRKAPVYTWNELDLPVRAEQAWAVLIRAADWPSWYANCRDVRFVLGGGPDLVLGMVFSWVTFGVRVTTTVTEFDPPHLLAWRGTGPGGRGYHSWLLQPRETGCRVVTEEVQHGLVPALTRWWIRPRLSYWHQRWLEGIGTRASG